MQKFKSVLSLSQTREQLGLNDDEIVVYVKSGYLHPLIKFGIDSEENIICEDFITAKHERIGYFERGIRIFNDEICFDCREIQALRDFRLDLDKVGNHCPDVKPDPSYVPEWERASADDYDPWGQRPRKIDPAQIPMAPKPPTPQQAQPQAPLPSSIGWQSKAQASARIAEPEKKATQCQGFNLEQAKQIEIRLAKLEREQGDRIWAQDVPPLLGMSPLQFVDMMNTGRGPVSSLEEFFREHDPKSGPFFKTSFFRDFPYIEGYGGTDSWTFHPLDILA